MRSRKPVILITNWHLRIGGVERKIVDIARHLSERPAAAHFEIYLLLNEAPPADPREGFFYEAVRGTSIKLKWKSRRGCRFFDTPFSIFLFWNILVLKPTVILCFLRRLAVFSVLFSGILFWRKTRVIVSDDTVTSMSLNFETKNPLKRRLAFGLIKQCYRRADRIVSPSRTSMQDLVNTFGIRKDKIIVNRNWVCGAVPAARPGYAYDAIYVGRIDPEKNIELMLEIMASVASRVSGFRACIVGNGNNLENVRRLLDLRPLRGCVELAGVQQHINRFLERSRVFCLTSRYEGFPIAAIEAMAQGLPVVTTAYPGAAELVVNGETGYICSSKSEYVEHLAELVENEAKRARMGDRARSYALATHGKENLEAFVKLLFAKTTG